MLRDVSVSSHPAESRMMLHDLTRRLTEEARSGPSDTPALGPYVTISRQAGSGGLAVARSVADRLGWSVLDRELVEDLARELELDPRHLQLMDETRSNWFRDTILNLLDSKLVHQDSFASLIGRVMVLAAHGGEVVVVGRAGHLILPRANGVSVRIVAPKAWRIARIAEREEIGERAAAEKVASLDAARSNFIRRHFKADPQDPAEFDLVIDVARFGYEATAKMIRGALEAQGLLGKPSC